MGTSRVLKLRKPDVCAQCGTAVAQGESAWWDAATKLVWCLTCREGGASSPGQGEGGAGDSPPSVLDGLPTLEPPDSGVAGGSAQREYERRHATEIKRLEERWGRLAGVAKFFHEDKSSTTSYAKGAEGERRAASFLERIVGARGVVLHDRKVPGTQGNIDHLVVVPSGVWIVDAKKYKGKVEQRDVGGLFKKDLRLYVGGRDRTSIAEGLGWQVLAVARVLEDTDIPIHPALLFVDSEWGFFAKSFEQCGTLVAPPKKLEALIAVLGPLSGSVIEGVTGTLARELPAKG
jgi:hypothetical protein